MTSYVDSVLAPGERIIHRAAISHWNFAVSYLVGLALLIGGGAAWIIWRQAQYAPAAAIPMIIGIIVLLTALIRRQSTELVLTDRRVISKRGLVSRDTVEMNLAKVESIHVSQSLLGRLLDYGDVTVVGTGASLEPLTGISAPLELRRKLGEVSQLREAKTS